MYCELLPTTLVLVAAVRGRVGKLLLQLTRPDPVPTFLYFLLPQGDLSETNRLNPLLALQATWCSPQCVSLPQSEF